MNKDFYNHNLKMYIKELIKLKEDYVNEICEITSYIETHGEKKENYNLTQFDIEEINEKRNYIAAIYELISDIDKLIKKE